MKKSVNIIPGSKAFKGFPVGPNQASTITTLNQAEQYGLMQPTISESSTKKERKHNSILDISWGIREIVQRRFDKQRRRRAEEYCDYIEAVSLGERLGGVPPITLYCPEQCVDNEEGIIYLPSRSTLVNLDGETQTEARFILRDRLEESGDWAIAATLYHGIDHAHAQQILHDFNRYAFPVKEQVFAALNNEGALTHLVHQACDELVIASENLNRHGIKPLKKHKHVTSYRSAIYGIIGAMQGVNGLKRFPETVSKLNNGANKEMLQPAYPFLLHFLSLANNHEEIGRTDPKICALFGAIYRDHKRLLSADEWQHAVSTYINTKSDVRGLYAAHNKEDAVLALFNFGRTNV